MVLYLCQHCLHDVNTIDKFTAKNKKSETLSLTVKGRQFLDDFKKANQALETALVKILNKDRFLEFKSALLILDNYFKTK